MSFENWHCAVFLWDVVPKTPRTVEDFGWRNFAVRSRLYLAHAEAGRFGLPFFEAFVWRK
ncbi:Hypothetical protein OINT_2001197 [Brucella intermedia LMG 3301]|uniref:Uncharacterized protein n=1 Tax=Brucella intermedia LMG 3301 TaxID=641118 RepID=C4WNS0_9HYPH|nr:Hypothetical protein OINT_2001197 [Brucella intermedia LMG 3301]